MSLEKCTIVNAIELDVVHAISGSELRHPDCLETLCSDCTIGIKIDIKEVITKRCPLCGANYISDIYSSCPYAGTINNKYECGTIVNICGRRLGTTYSYSITSVSIGSKCYGMSNTEDII